MNYISIKRELNTILDCSRNNMRLCDYFKDLRDKKIVIYGAGFVGRYVCDILMKNRLYPICFFDAKGEVLGSYAGIPVKTIEYEALTNEDKENLVIILCVISNIETENRITDTLRALGYKYIIPFKQKAFSSDFILKKNIIYSEASIYDYKDEILSCIELLADEKSLITYKNSILSFSLRKFENLPFN